MPTQSAKTIFLASLMMTAVGPIGGQAPPATAAIPEGTMVRVRLEETLSSQTARPGDAVRLSVPVAVRINGRMVIAAGAAAKGSISEARAASGRSELDFGKLEYQADAVQAVDGTWVKVRPGTEAGDGGVELSADKSKPAKKGGGFARGLALQGLELGVTGKKSKSAKEEIKEMVALTIAPGEVQTVFTRDAWQFAWTAEMQRASAALSPQFALQSGHSGNVAALAVSPDGTWVASGAESVRIWDLTTGKQMLAISAAEDVSNACVWKATGALPLSLAVSPNGKWLAVGYSTGHVVNWDVASWQPVRSFCAGKIAPAEVWSLSFRADSRALAAGSRGVDVFDVGTGKRINSMAAAVMQQDQAIHAVSFSTDGNEIAVGGSDGNVEIWNVQTKKQRLSLKHGGTVMGGVFSHDSQWVASGGDDAKIRMWESQTGRLLRTIDVQAPVKALARSADSARLIAAGKDGTVHVFDAATGAELRTFGAGSGSTFAAAIDEKGLIAASGGDDRVVRVWNVPDGRMLQQWAGRVNGQGHASGNTAGTLLATGDGSPEIMVWNLRTGRVTSLKGHEGPVNALVFQPRTDLLASGGTDAKIRIWNADTGAVTATLQGHAGKVLSLAYSPDGSRLASAGDDKTVRLWDAKTGQAIGSFAEHSAAVNVVAFSPDGKQLVSGGADKHLIFWSAEDVKWKSNKAPVIATKKTGTVFLPLVENAKSKTKTALSEELADIVKRGIEFQALAFSADSKELVSAGLIRASREAKEGKGRHVNIDDNRLRNAETEFGGIMIWNTEKQSLSAVTVTQSSVNSVAWSPDGSGFVLGRKDHSLKLSSAKIQFEHLRHARSDTNLFMDLYQRGQADSQREIAGTTLYGHSDEVQTVTFVSPGVLASASVDGSTVLWDWKTQKPIATLASVGSGEYVMVTPSGHYLASKGAYPGIGFRIDNHAYPFEQFDLRLNRPDTVLAKLGHASEATLQTYKTAWRKRLSKMGYDEKKVEADVDAPRLELTGTLPGVASTAREVSFSIKADGGEIPLERLHLWVNGVPVYGSAGMSLRESKSATLVKKIDLALSNGRNKVQVAVSNEAGLESLKAGFETTYTGPASLPQLTVISIGVSKYKDDRYNLTYAAKDANDLATLFEQEKRADFADVNVIRLLDEAVTVDSIRALKKTLAATKPDDQVIVFLAGHGMLSDKLDYYFGTHDVDFTKPENGGLPYEEIEDLLDGIPARNKLMMIDTCHAGEVDKENTVLTQQTKSDDGVVNSRGMRVVKNTASADTAQASVLLEEMFSDLRRGSGAAVIASSGGMEYALEGNQWKNGVFTYAVLDGMKSGKADLNKDGSVRASELRDYVTSAVSRLTNGAQKPVARRQTLDLDFKVR